MAAVRRYCYSRIEDAVNVSIICGGYSMKTDTQIRDDIFQELKWDPRVRNMEIGAAWSAAGVTEVEDKFTIGV